MRSKSKKTMFIFGVVVIIIGLFLAVMTVNYPFSHFSLKKSYTFNPKLILYNGKTFEEKLTDFKHGYLQRLDTELSKAPEKQNGTIVRIEYVFNLFEQDWLIDTEPVVINKEKMTEILFYVEQWRNTLLNLMAQVDYTVEQRMDLIDTVQRLLHIEKSINQLQAEKYFSKRELNILLGNLQGELQSEFEIFISTFYDQIN